MDIFYVSMDKTDRNRTRCHFHLIFETVLYSECPLMNINTDMKIFILCAHCKSSFAHLFSRSSSHQYSSCSHVPLDPVKPLATTSASGAISWSRQTGKSNVWNSSLGLRSLQYYFSRTFLNRTVMLQKATPCWFQEYSAEPSIKVWVFFFFSSSVNLSMEFSMKK